jgi:serine/threonine protein kinase
MLNERSDVYSFGVLVMEMITGRTPVDYTRPTAEVSRRFFLSTALGHSEL